MSAAPSQRPGWIIERFAQGEDFAASNAAEAWCKARGVSVGEMQRDAPRALMYGDFDIGKWRDISRAELKTLDGTMEGDMRNGPVIVQLRVRESQT